MKKWKRTLSLGCALMLSISPSFSNLSSTYVYAANSMTEKIEEVQAKVGETTTFVNPLVELYGPNGTIVSYSIENNATLPAGLQFNNGRIYGTPEKILPVGNTIHINVMDNEGNTKTYHLLFKITAGTPEVPTVPVLKASVGDTLSSLYQQFPISEYGTFSFENEDMVLTTSGEHIFKATFESSSPNYADVENIDIKIYVYKGVPNTPEIPLLTATYGQKLWQIESQLPHGYSFVDSEKEVGNVGTHTVYVNYTPEDEDNYEEVLNVPTNITVYKADVTTYNADYQKEFELSGVYGQYLEELKTQLPEGYYFNDETIVCNTVGEMTVGVYYNPDIESYHSATDIKAVINVKQATPVVQKKFQYTVDYNSYVSDLPLLDGYSISAKEDAKFKTIGVLTYKGSYTPSDTTNYESLSDIIYEITVQKTNPEYQVTPVHVIVSQNADDILTQLGNNFSFDGEQAVSLDSNFIYVNYTPTNTYGYNTIKHIKVPITVYPELTGIYQESTNTLDLPDCFSLSAQTPSKLGNVGTRTYPFVYTNPVTEERIVYDIPVTIKKAVPEITVCTLSAIMGQTLDEIQNQMPNGCVFEENQELTEDTTVLYANYIPNDTNNYTTVEHIAFPVNVHKALTGVYNEKIDTIALPENYKFERSTPDYVGEVGTQYYKVLYTDYYNQVYVYSVPVTVSKNKPKYTTKTLNAIMGQSMEDIEKQLDYGYSFEPNQGFALDTKVLYVTYTPDDTENTEIIEHIAFPLNVHEALTIKHGTEISKLQVPAGYTVSTVNPTVAIGVGTQVYKLVYNNKITYDVPVTVEKGIPNCPKTLMTLSVTYGDTLADISLPEHYYFNDTNYTFNEAGLVTLTGKYSYNDNNYETIEVIHAITVKPKKITSNMISYKKNMLYTGKSIQALKSIKNKGITLIKNVDYSVTYQKNKKAGWATMTIRGEGNYKGKVVKQFRILPYKLTTTKKTLSFEFVANMEKSKIQKVYLQKTNKSHSITSRVSLYSKNVKLNKTKNAVTCPYNKKYDTMKIVYIDKNGLYETLKIKIK